MLKSPDRARPVANGYSAVQPTPTIRSIVLRNIIPLVILVATAATAPAEAIIFSDGQVHVVSDATYAADPIQLDNAGTTLHMEAGALVGGPVNASQDTRFWMLGGTLTGDLIPAYGAHVEVDAGVIEGFVQIFSASDVVIRGGEFVRPFIVRFNGHARIEGGVFMNQLQAIEQGSLELVDGTFQFVLTAGTSSTTILGGTFTDSIYPSANATLDIVGGDFQGPLVAADEASLRVHGRDFQVNGQPVPYGPIALATGNLTGELASGAPLDVTFNHQSTTWSGTITLVQANAVPVSSPGGLLGLAGLLGGTGLFARRTRPR